MATAELAVALPTLVLMLFLALAGLATVTDQVRCVDAARATARAVARGDDQGAARLAGQRLAPPGASISVGAVGSGRGSEVIVVVRGKAAPGLAWLGSHVSPVARAVAAREEVGADVSPP